MALPLPHGLDVWAPNKVLNIEWDDKGTVALASLRGGSWEAELIKLSEAEAPCSHDNGELSCSVSAASESAHLA